jgi:hypothetical protein
VDVSGEFRYAGGRGLREEVAGRVGAVGDEGEYLGYQPLLDAGVELGVKFGKARLAGVVEDENGVDHCGGKDAPQSNTGEVDGVVVLYGCWRFR